MRETLTILETLEKFRERGQKAALATVVRTSGSTYRKEGAKMIISEKGEMVGSISAGCLEADVFEIVPEIIRTGQPKLLKYDNTAAEEIIWGLGLGCNGVVEVFVEPFSVERKSEKRRALSSQLSQFEMNFYQILKSAFEDEKPVTMATVIKSEREGDIPAGQKMLVFPEGSSEGGLEDIELETKVKKDALKLISEEKSKTHDYDFGSQKIEVYIESVLPPPPLVIIGADPDALPIVNLGKELGFKVTVVDHRPNFASSEKYPQADETVVVLPEEIAAKVPLTEKTFVLIKTHNYLKDKEILKQVLKSNVRYVGQLGPKARADDLLKDLCKDGVEFTSDELEKLHAPVGLDIGAESPEQISLSIFSEMLAVKNGRPGGFLKDQTEAIHPRE